MGCRTTSAGAAAATGKVDVCFVSIRWKPGSRSAFARVSSFKFTATDGGAASTMSAVTGGADAPVTTFTKMTGPRPNKQKTPSHAVRATICIPQVESARVMTKSGDKQAISAKPIPNFDCGHPVGKERYELSRPSVEDRGSRCMAILPGAVVAGASVSRLHEVRKVDRLDSR